MWQLLLSFLRSVLTFFQAGFNSCCTAQGAAQNTQAAANAARTPPSVPSATAAKEAAPAVQAPINISIAVTNDSPSSTRRQDNVPIALKNGPDDIADVNRAYMHSYLRERHFKSAEEIRQLEAHLDAVSDIECIWVAQPAGPSAEAALEPLSSGQRINPI